MPNACRSRWVAVALVSVIVVGLARLAHGQMESTSPGASQDPPSSVGTSDPSGRIEHLSFILDNGCLYTAIHST